MPIIDILFLDTLRPDMPGGRPWLPAAVPQTWSVDRWQERNVLIRSVVKTTPLIMRQVDPWGVPYSHLMGYFAKAFSFLDDMCSFLDDMCSLFVFIISLHWLWD